MLPTILHFHFEPFRNILAQIAFIFSIYLDLDSTLNFVSGEGHGKEACYHSGCYYLGRPSSL